MKLEEVNLKTKEAVNYLVQSLEAGHSTVLTQYLGAMAKFRNYSFGNIMLIARQKPDATNVAGLRTWNSLGRFVKRGEKGILILAPMIGHKKTDSVAEATEDAKVNIVAHRPVPAAAADAVDEAGEDFAPLRRVHHFRVKLQAEHPSGAVLNGGVGGVLCDGDRFEASRQLRQLVPMRVPHLHGLRQAGEEGTAAVLDAERALAVFALLARLNLPAEILGEELET